MFILWASLIATVRCLGQGANTKIIDVRAYAIAGPSIVAPNNGYPVLIPTSNNMFTLTVALGDMIYSVEVPQSRHVKPTEVIVGDPVEAHLEMDKLIVIDPSGKQIKEKIIRRKRMTPSK